MISTGASNPCGTLQWQSNPTFARSRFAPNLLLGPSWSQDRARYSHARPYHYGRLLLAYCSQYDCCRVCCSRCWHASLPVVCPPELWVGHSSFGHPPAYGAAGHLPSELGLLSTLVYGAGSLSAALGLPAVMLVHSYCGRVGPHRLPPG